MPAIRQLPFPHLTKEACHKLTKAVVDIEKSWKQRKKISPDSLQLIDDVLRAAYKLDDETYERLSLIAEWDTRSPTTLDRQFDPQAQWEISGVAWLTT